METSGALVKREKEYQIKFNPDYYVVTANDLIRGRQKMTVREAWLLFAAMSQVVKEDKDFKTYTTTIPELAEFMGVHPDVLYRDIEGICENLLKRVVSVQVGGENVSDKKRQWEMFHWVERAQYNAGKLTLRLSDDIKPYMIDLVSHYNQVQLKALCSYSSYYATRLFQILNADVGQSFGQKDTWEYSCEELRELFQVQKQYKLKRDLINRTIKPALEELKNSDYVFIWGYQEHKSRTRGNPLIGVSFKAKIFQTKEEKDHFVNLVVPTLRKISPEEFTD